MRTLLATAAAAGALCFAGAANAALLDFTANPVTPLSGSAGGVSYTVSATGGAITNSDNADGSSCTSNSIGLACAKDGLGITDDEVTDAIKSGESLTISFGHLVAVSAIDLLDLFSSQNGFEVANIAWDGGSFSIGSAADEALQTGLSGLAEWFGSVHTTFLTFTAPNISGDDGTNDFAVAGLQFQEVPLPAALPLFLAGLAGLGFARGKKRKTA